MASLKSVLNPLAVREPLNGDRDLPIQVDRYDDPHPPNVGTALPTDESPTVLSTGAIIGTAISGAVLVCLLLAMIGFLLYYRRKKQRQVKEIVPNKIVEDGDSVQDVEAAAPAAGKRGAVDTGHPAKPDP